MRAVTLDASVILKWFFAAEREPGWPRAQALATDIARFEVELIQPPHWLAEVLAVISRKRSELAPDALNHLALLNPPVLGSLNVYLRATRIAATAGVHLFDSLYHGVALESNSTLITADHRYYRAARKFGNITLL